MERKFERTVEQNKPLGSLGDRSKNKDFDLDSKTINKKQSNKKANK